MKEIITCLSLILSLSCALAQEVKIVPVVLKDKSIELYIHNQTFQGQSVLLDCELKGMTSTEKLPITKFLEVGEKVLFTTLAPKDIYKPFGYGTSILYVEGDVQAKHDDNYVYLLPYPKGTSYNIDQGYLGNKTHENLYALDFNMDVGAEITAIRDGIVTKVIERYDKGCPDESCEQYNNLVLVTHEDGSIANYAHLKKNGAIVKVGDRVKAGDLIGLSGATGWASGPHLHLEVYTASWDGKITLPVNYYLDEKTTGEPQVNQVYAQKRLK
ncbi:M23 family metallopeptidase [Marinoscillum sp. MHG1-6]|uniref:M23 family metallopeptidase n=1 Tax=Marinoscillum sp. MHG1-6 TaxID=2959627 RepID=UPI00280BEBFC|nr:M23 family metallopeptidase [Marinoscillum sp. MHG1-6]